MNGTQQTVDGRPAVRIERRLAHPVERVWRAITEPEELRQWSPGGEETGSIREVDPPRLVVYESERDTFRFELLPDGDGCRLVFTHVFDDPAIGERTAAGWEIYFDRFDVHLAGGFLSEEDAHRTVTLDDGPILRIERRFGHSQERVWRAITDPDELRHWFPDVDLEVTESDPPRVLAGSWHGDSLHFELTPDGDGCVLVFHHAFADRATAARDAAGWDACFVRLSALLAGTPIGEAESLRIWPALHERHAERFRVDPELGRKAFADHSSRS
jgi:Activator of Hsp90 ATPase homolog 1-like protein